MEVFFWMLLILVPLILLRRLRKNLVGALMNPMFYILGFSYLYLIVPSLYIDFVIYDVFKLNISSEVFIQSQFLCLWYVCVFFFIYLFTPDKHIELNERPSSSVYLVSYGIYCAFIIFLIVILWMYFPIIYSLRDDRIEALKMYETLIAGPFRLYILVYILFGVTSILILYTRKLIYLGVFVLLAFLDFAHGGRTLTFMAILFSVVHIVIIKKRLYVGGLIVIVGGLVTSALFQRKGIYDLKWTLYSMGTEFSNTRLTTTLILNDPHLSDNFVNYIAVAFSKIIPGSFLQFKLLDTSSWYANEVYKTINLNFGLAGNIVSESLYYGGFWFAMFTPLIIGMFYFVLHKYNSYKSLVGYLYLLFIIIKSQDMMRSYFYLYFFYFLQIIFIFMFYVLIDIKRRIFK